MKLVDTTQEIIIIIIIFIGIFAYVYEKKLLMYVQKQILRNGL